MLTRRKDAVNAAADSFPANLHDTADWYRLRPDRCILGLYLKDGTNRSSEDPRCT
jgi:hypothetical protein